MFLECTSPCKVFAAFLTLVRFLSCVQCVSQKVPLFSEALATSLALVRFIPGAYEFMVFESMFCSEALATFLTDTPVGFLSCVYELMPLEVRFQYELFATFLTLVPLLFHVLVENENIANYYLPNAAFRIKWFWSPANKHVAHGFTSIQM